MKNLCIKNPKPKNFGLGLALSLTSQCTNIKLSDKSKKQKWILDKRNITSSADAIELIEIKHKAKKQKQDNWSFKNKNISEITYYNYDKKGHYTKNCFEPDKNAPKDQ